MQVRHGGDHVADLYPVHVYGPVLRLVAVLLQSLRVTPSVRVDLLKTAHSVLRPNVETLKAPIRVINQLLEARNHFCLYLDRVNRL